jgi:hypothetical protein
MCAPGNPPPHLGLTAVKLLYPTFTWPIYTPIDVTLSRGLLPFPRIIAISMAPAICWHQRLYLGPSAHAPDTSRELLQAFSDFRGDHELWVAILTGAGEKAFSAGADLVPMDHLPADVGHTQRRAIEDHIGVFQVVDLYQNLHSGAEASGDVD